MDTWRKTHRLPAMFANAASLLSAQGQTTNSLSDGSTRYEWDYERKTHRAIFNVNEMKWKHWGLHMHISMGPKHTKEMNEHEARAGSLLESVIGLHGDKKRRRKTKNWHLSDPKSTDGHHITPYIPSIHPPYFLLFIFLHPTLHCSMHVLTEYAPGSYFWVRSSKSSYFSRACWS